MGDKAIDPFNNSYFEVKAYVVDNNQTYSERQPRDKELELTLCSKEEIGKYHTKAQKKFSDRTVCFKNPDDINIISDWWVEGTFRSIVVAIEKCNSTNKKCAEEPER